MKKTTNKNKTNIVRNRESNTMEKILLFLTLVTRKMKANFTNHLLSLEWETITRMLFRFYCLPNSGTAKNKIIVLKGVLKGKVKQTVQLIKCQATYSVRKLNHTEFKKKIVNSVILFLKVLKIRVCFFVFKSKKDINERKINNR